MWGRNDNIMTSGRRYRVEHEQKVTSLSVSVNQTIITCI